VVAVLLSHICRQIWCSTTPVTSHKSQTTAREDGSLQYVAADVIRYNQAAAEVVASKEGVSTHDLYAFALPLLPTIQLERNVHFHEAGSELLGESVAASVRQHLQRPM
jgi:hypothetical protein